MGISIATRKFLVSWVAVYSLLSIQNIDLSAQDSGVVAHFKKLTKSTEWKLVEIIKMKFKTYHSQGMVIVEDHIYFSSVEVIVPTEKYGRLIDGYDRTVGEGNGYLFKSAGTLNLVVLEGTGVEIGSDGTNKVKVEAYVTADSIGISALN